MEDPLNTPDVNLTRMPKRQLPEFNKVIIPFVSVTSGAMLGLAMPAVIGAESLFDYLKCTGIAIGAGTISYAINRLALERGTVQAAIGTTGAGLVSTLSILIVGAGMFAATYPGFTIEKIDQLQLARFGVDQAAYVDGRTRSALENARVAPALKSVVEDLAAKMTCERDSSCVTGNGNGGEGPGYRALSGIWQSTSVIVSELSGKEAAFNAALEGMEAAQNAYQRVVSDPSLSARERRLQAMALANEIAQLANFVDDAAPLSLVTGHAQALSKGVSIPGRPETEAAVNGVLAGHAGKLEHIAASGTGFSDKPPVFPAQAGVSDTFSYIGHFLPLALIIAVVELIFPIIFWLYTYFALLIRLERDDPRNPAPRETLARRHSERRRTRHSKRG